MLEKLLFAGVLLPFMAKKPVPKAQVFDRSGAVDLAPIPAPIGTHSATDAAAVSWPVMTPIEAAKAFFLEMQHHAAGEALQMRWVRHSYDVLARDRGWPALSDKSLSQHMVSFGCKRKKADLRKSGGGRVTVFEFPLETTAQRRRRRK